MEKDISPKISVILPVFNGAFFIQQAIQSILSQTFSDFEFIIIDDGSKDGSVEIVEAINDPRIVFLKHEQNKGVVSTLNEGISLARGTYIARMDADDISRPERFKRQIEILDTNPQYAAVFTRVQLIDVYGNPQGKWNEDTDNVTENQIRTRLPVTNCLAHPTLMIRKDVLKKYQYDAALKASEDWGLWLDLAADSYSLYKIDEALVLYRIHPASETAKANTMNVNRKIIMFKKNYLLQRLKKGNWKPYHFKVFLSLCLNVISFPFKKFVIQPLWMGWKVIKKKPFHILISLIQLKSTTKQLNNSSLFFFLPYFHTGGAERIHLSIVNSVKDKHPYIFFTRFSLSNAMLNQFKNAGICINIPQLCSYPFIDRITLTIISRAINRHQNPVVFGCNNRFFYDLLPKLKQETKCIDLIHAFVHPLEDGPEKWSLPVVDRLTKRVFVSHQGVTQMKDLYKKNNLMQFADRIIYIQNAVKLNEIKIEPVTTLLQIIYIGRETAEKRVRLVGKIASQVKEIDKTIDFVLVGNLIDAVDEGNKKDCIFTGEITDSSAMQLHLSSSHILLLTSMREGMPLVVMEGMANALTIISTNVGDVPVHVKNGESGYIIDEATEEKMVSDFCQKILMLNKDRTLLNTLRTNAWNYAKNNFSEEKFTAAYRSVLTT